MLAPARRMLLKQISLDLPRASSLADDGLHGYPSSAAQIGLLLPWPWRASALGWRICSCEISADDLAAKLPIDPLRAGFALARLGLGARRWETSMAIIWPILHSQPSIGSSAP
jgi:hypothetical protein|eukprot:COSAG01_NODE_17608_length_1136_cov_2.373796_1_plen_113_part_00